MRRLVILTISVADCLWLAPARAASAMPQATAPALAQAPLSNEDWREDLRALASAVAAKHNNAFTITSREKFQRAVDDLNARLDGLTDWQRFIEFKRLVAMVGDAHTNLDDSRARLPRRVFPFSVLLLKDGVRVTATTPELQSLLGAKITRIGAADIEAAIERIGTIIPHENQPWLLNQARVWLNSPEALQALGLIEDIERAPFTFIDASGSEVTVTLASMPAGQSQSPAPQLRPQSLPLTLRPRAGGAIFGSIMLEDSRDLYVWYDSCSNTRDKTVAAFCEETLAAIDRDKPQRVIIDLRRNGGGNSALILPLVHGLASRRGGKQGLLLFALIGRNTFSSGLWAAEDLKRKAGAVLAGGPTGGRPNSFGEVRTFQLPHSGFTLSYSTKKWTRDPDSDPESLEPDVLAEPTYEDLIAGKDVAIEAVRAYIAPD